MGDEKLSALTELAATPADADEVYIRDVSEAAADESKRITIANLMAAASAGASLTVAETEVFSASSPTTWTDLDLSGTVGSNVALVILKVYAVNRYLAVRKNGDTDEQFTASPDTAGAGRVLGKTGIFSILIALTDSSGKVEIISSLAASMTIDVIAYIK